MLLVLYKPNYEQSNNKRAKANENIQKKGEEKKTSRKQHTRAKVSEQNALNHSI